MVAIPFAALIVCSMAIALIDWRRAWLLVILCGLLQDPARKLTTGSPVVMTFSVVALYAAILFSAQRELKLSVRDFQTRFASLSSIFPLLLFTLALATANGVITYGIQYWKAPALSLVIYLLPLPAILLGYVYLDSETRLYRFLLFYAAAVSLMLAGSLLEYRRVDFPALGLVAQPGDYIRHLPGLQIRMISGFFRAPDIMGWHAATLTSICIAFVVRSGAGRRSLPWVALGGWGFFNCMISGRRKAVYYVAVFSAVFLWRYFRRLKPSQIAGAIAIAIVLAGVVHQISSNERTTVYAKGAETSRIEIAERLSGGVLETIRQAGILGAGLGTATQGVQHLLGPERTLSWQEGGLGKLTIELGVPGLLVAIWLTIAAVRSMLRITAIPDHPDTSQLGRVALFSLIAANGVNFMASAQAYSDPLLAMLSTFFVGCLFATVTLDERAAAAAAAAARPRLAPATA